MAATSWSMVMATRSGFDGAVSFAGCAPAAAGDGEGNSVTWLVLASSPLAARADGKAFAAAGNSAGSSAGAIAVAMPREELLPPRKPVQSYAARETFPTFPHDSSPP